MTKIIFCAQCAVDKAHELTVDANHEIVATDDQGHFIKFPTPATPAQLQEWIDQHKAHNEARAVQAAVDNDVRRQLDELLAQL